MVKYTMKYKTRNTAKRIVLGGSLIFFSSLTFASSAKISTLDNKLEEVNTVEVSLAQKKTEKRGAWEGDASVGKTKSFATSDSPETATLDLTEGIDYSTLKDWTLGIDAKQDHEDDGLNVIETGLYVQKKVYYTKPPKKKKKPKSDDDGDDDEPFYPSLTLKVRVASGSTSEGTGQKKTIAGIALPQLIGFKEKNEGLYLTWDFAESCSVGLQFTQYQYQGFDKTQAYLYAHPGIATRLSGATSSVSSVVDHEEIANIDWFIWSAFDINFTETLQTDYVTGDVGSTEQIDATWEFIPDWSVTFTGNYEHITAVPASPINTSGSPAQDVWAYGLAVAYNW